MMKNRGNQGWRKKIWNNHKKGEDDKGEKGKNAQKTNMKG